MLPCAWPGSLRNSSQKGLLPVSSVRLPLPIEAGPYYTHLNEALPSQIFLLPMYHTPFLTSGQSALLKLNAARRILQAQPSGQSSRKLSMTEGKLDCKMRNGRKLSGNGGKVSNQVLYWYRTCAVFPQPSASNTRLVRGGHVTKQACWHVKYCNPCLL